ncbi:MAG: hypothetical protein A4E66_02485 [Syntrophus sp. PtaB.Bin001]|nr:MAG: hypothetical protein A4E66_02485 [Syntrophus sp. PtaB.Bin001]
MRNIPIRYQKIERRSIEQAFQRGLVIKGKIEKTHDPGGKEKVQMQLAVFLMEGHGVALANPGPFQMEDEYFHISPDFSECPDDSWRYQRRIVPVFFKKPVQKDRFVFQERRLHKTFSRMQDLLSE